MLQTAGSEKAGHRVFFFGGAGGGGGVGGGGGEEEGGGGRVARVGAPLYAREGLLPHVRPKFVVDSDGTVREWDGLSKPLRL